MKTTVAPALRWVLPAGGWLAGTAAQLQVPALWPATWLGVLVAAAALIGAIAWHWRARTAGALLLALAGAALGFAATHAHAAWRLAQALPPKLEGQDLVLTGVVASLPRVSLIGTRFVFEVQSAHRNGDPVTVPSRLSLGWYRGFDEDALLGGPAEDLRAGQRWQLPVRLRLPHGTLNPHGFDYELWLFEQGIRATGTVRSPVGALARRLQQDTGAPARLLQDDAGHPVQRLRQDLRDAIALRVPDAAAAGVLAALAVGDQAAIERADWDVFRATGVAHLMAISGLHVTMFAWLAGALLNRLWRLQPRLMLALPAPMAARWGGLLAAVAYAQLAGWGVPSQRTVWMIATVALLRSSGRRWPLPAVLLAAALAVTVPDPWALLQPGFWLSFVAVALLVASEPVQAQAGGDQAASAAAGWRARVWRSLHTGLRTQLVATVGLAPLSMLFFQQISLVGLLANLLAIPLVTLLITPLALLGVLLPPLWLAGASLVQGLMAVLQWLAGWPWATWSAAVAPPWAVACGLLAGVLAVLPLPRRLRLLTLPLMLPLLVPPVVRPARGDFELVAADVGQGSAVLLRTASHMLLYDAGPQYSAESDAAGRVLLPLLRARGESRLDLLMLSHRDTDHVGGAATVLGGMPVARVLSSLAEEHPLRSGDRPHRRCEAGQQWQWDGVHFEVLHPPAADYAQPALKPNALSCVLRVQGRRASVLLTGDIAAAQEAALLARLAPAGQEPGAGDVGARGGGRATASATLRSDVLIAPHHGSRTSSSSAFVAGVQPQVAVMQAGYRNRYGHPAPEVLARYRAAGVPVVLSSACGAWTLPATSAAGSLPTDALFSGICQRSAARRYWHHQGQAVAP